MDTEASLDRHAGVSTELVPIGSFNVVGGDYTVTVDPDGSSGRANVAVVVADPNPESSGSDLMLWGGLGGALAVVVGATLAIGAGRRRDRARVRALVESRTPDASDPS